MQPGFDQWVMDERTRSHFQTWPLNTSHWILQHSPVLLGWLHSCVCVMGCMELPRWLWWWRTHLPMQETRKTWVWSLDWENSLEEEHGIHLNILAWKIPCTRGGWWTIGHGVAKSWTQLSDWVGCVTSLKSCVEVLTLRTFDNGLIWTRVSAVGIKLLWGHWNKPSSSMTGVLIWRGTFRHSQAQREECSVQVVQWVRLCFHCRELRSQMLHIVA